MANVSLIDEIEKIAGNDQELLDFLRTFMRKPIGLKVVLNFGDRLLYIKKEICKNDMATFEKAMDLISKIEVTNEKIQSNLNLEKILDQIEKESEEKTSVL